MQWRTCTMFMISIVMAGLTPLSPSAETTPVVGLRENMPNIHAFINARIIVKPGLEIERGALVVRDGVIVAVGEDAAPPADARIWDCDGLTIYPGLIESWLPVSASEHDEEAESRYWNANIRPERDALEMRVDESVMNTLRSMGFTSAMAAPVDGLLAGRAAVVTLEDTPLKDRILRRDVALTTGQRTGGGYPTSLMGQTALTRQALYDAQWHRGARRAYQHNPAQNAPESNLSLEALSPVLDSELPVLFLTLDSARSGNASVNFGNDSPELRYQRRLALAHEFSLMPWVVGSGYEYRDIDLYKDNAVPLILPLIYPKKPKNLTHAEALELRLTALRHWEMAPSNAAILERDGVSFSLTAAGPDGPGSFAERVREARERGLSDETILAALTTIPARRLGLEGEIGTLKENKRGHFIITDGDLFGEDTKILDVWIDGARTEVNRKPAIDPRGSWAMTLPHTADEILSATLEIEGDLPGVRAALIPDATPIRANWTQLQYNRLSFNLAGNDFGHPGVLQFSAVIRDDRMEGAGAMPDGTAFVWQAERIETEEEKQVENENEKESESEKAFVPIAQSVYPPAPFGRETRLPDQPKHLFIQQATVWTGGPQGILKEADVLITEGKIAAVGPNLTPPDEAIIIDAAGKHITPGLIDCHSHSAVSMRSINEVGSAITSEVRIADVINSHDVNLYRQLAGGLTMAHILHGSANPIGGQSALIKLRWGGSPHDLLETRAPATIKFALGENVKQSRSASSTRYPQTRMGVEQIIRDRFMAAHEYGRDWEAYERAHDKARRVPPRRNLELEPLLEILREERWIHCHSYRQDEILMLMRLGEELGFRVWTFQHILEGYKVADAMAQHGATGSAFSDWWAFKVESYDAIPYAGAIMHEQGVLVSFNSDSNELARRMNTEAAKAVKYGGVSEEEALQFVTLNAAKQLKIDQYVGSLEPGKDADFVIWSGHPFSTYTICEQTWIDGRKYFDLQEDMKLRQALAEERNRLIQKLLDAKPAKEESEEEELSDEESAFWFGSIDWSDQRGVCGCLSEEDAQALFLRSIQDKIDLLRRER